MTRHRHDREIVLWIAAIAAFVVAVGQIGLMVYAAVFG